MRTDKKNIIAEKSVEFALSIIEYCEKLQKLGKTVVAKQLLRSSTGIGANIFEAQNAESRLDFIHKMKIAAKEASETLFWLVLCERSSYYDFDVKLRKELDEILMILSKIISSAKVSSR